ncbi:hypothetical protein K461DRAFT_281759 [Myriangium duriaei CBS 260.36]|uniref:Zn(2)-C6 fungal-type domain-containing protein n=1 Tax=Myriangium duriaei CBS 260.36 TaxID=1168546 RepID=A0A9P4IYX9_9PEZI|nr:hypothetical protein K461DRAFT_281759 [Myriangium duriaei CBS 260.36]
MSSDPSKRRNRTQRSCQPCRIGKLRCNRELPCSECVKRSRETSCVYAQQVQESMAYRSQARVMRQKLDNLERVVKSLRQGAAGDAAERSSKQATADPAATVRDDETSSQQQIDIPQGKYRITANEEAFVGPAHWESIVNDIAEVRAYLEDDPSVQESSDGVLNNESSPSDAGAVKTPDLFCNGHSVLTIQELVGTLPPKATCDRLVAAWFNSMDNYKHIVHIPTFQRQYAQFWRSQSHISPVWLALLFNILALGSQYLSKEPAFDDASQPGAQLHSLASHAIHLADYAKPKMYILEALILYIRYGQMKSDESQLRLWLTLGLVTRLSTRMGLFRDPSYCEGISPFVAEMRRRVWHCICYMDICFSYQIGLVSAIHGLPANAALPSNLNDSDFDPESKVLPPAWPMDKYTNLTYVIIMGQLTNVFAEAVTLSNAMSPPGCSEIEKLETKIRTIGNEMPENLRMRPLDKSFGDPPALIMERLRLDLVYTKAICVLYRRYLCSDRHEDRRKCTESADQILALHALLDEAAQPTGQLESCHYQEIRDCMDCFILAGIITGVEISDAYRHPAGSAKQCYSSVQLEHMRKMLRTSCDIWMRWTFAPRKARRAAFAMIGMLDKHASPKSTPVQPELRADESTSLPDGVVISTNAQIDGPALVDGGFWTDDMNSAIDYDSFLNMDTPDPSSFQDIFDTPFDDSGMNWVSHIIVSYHVQKQLADSISRACGTH